jgi:hypothetical protein
MTAVIVYSFQAWDESTGEYKLSRRMATRKGIEMCKGKVLEDTAIEIDSSQLERGEGLDPRICLIQHIVSMPSQGGPSTVSRRSVTASRACCNSAAWAN